MLKVNTFIVPLQPITNKRMNIALIDDHLLLSETLAHALRQHVTDASIKVFNNGTSFFSSNLKDWVPNIVIVDMLMPGMNGLEVMENAFLTIGRTCKFILLSSITDVHTIKNAMRLGASGYLSKDSTLDEVLEAIQMVADDEQYIGKSLRNNLIKHVFAGDQINFQLSPREKEVLDKICGGNTPKEIAYELELSLHTVQEYLRSVMRKLKVNRTTDLVVFAIQKGLYNPSHNK